MPEDDLDLVDFSGERVVDDLPETRRYVLDGMEAYDMTELGYPGMYGVHVGDADEWIPVLSHDGFISRGALVFELDFDAWNREHPELPFYWIEDPHPIDRTETPESFIVFSEMPAIPAEIVSLEQAHSAEDVYEMEAEYYGEEEDEEEFFDDD